MSPATPLGSTVVVLAIAGALAYGVRTVWRTARLKKTAPLATPRSGTPADPAREVPSMRFKGEIFESDWQGSRGYTRPTNPTADENWTDRLVIATWSRLRPSRFGDRRYWTHYLPGVRLTFLVLVLGGALFAAAYVQPTSGDAGGFTPSAQQRAVPDLNSDYVTTPDDCDPTINTTPPPAKAIAVNWSNDGNILWVPARSVVAITYLYGKPVFSRGTPLCTPAPPSGRANVVDYRAADSGSGYIYLPQPNGTIVVRIDIAPNYTSFFVLLVVLLLIVVGLDVFLARRLRRATSARYSDVPP